MLRVTDLVIAGGAPLLDRAAPPLCGIGWGRKIKGHWSVNGRQRLEPRHTASVSDHSHRSDHVWLRFSHRVTVRPRQVVAIDL